MMRRYRFIDPVKKLNLLLRSDLPLERRYRALIDLHCALMLGSETRDEGGNCLIKIESRLLYSSQFWMIMQLVREAAKDSGDEGLKAHWAIVTLLKRIGKVGPNAAVLGRKNIRKIYKKNISVPRNNLPTVIKVIARYSFDRPLDKRPVSVTNILNSIVNEPRFGCARGVTVLSNDLMMYRLQTLFWFASDHARCAWVGSENSINPKMQKYWLEKIEDRVEVERFAGTLRLIVDIWRNEMRNTKRFQISNICNSLSSVSECVDLERLPLEVKAVLGTERERTRKSAERFTF